MAVTRLQVLTGKPRRPGGTCDGTCGGGHPAPIELPAVFPTDRNAGSSKRDPDPDARIAEHQRECGFAPTFTE